MYILPGAKAAISDFDGSDTMTALPNFNEFASLATIFITAPPAQYLIAPSKVSPLVNSSVLQCY